MTIGFEGLPYECTNDDCPAAGKMVGVKRGEEATCSKCGWMMTAVPLAK